MQNVQMIFVNESGFYALVLGSKLPSAVMFKDWVIFGTGGLQGGIHLDYHHLEISKDYLEIGT